MKTEEIFIQSKIVKSKGKALTVFDKIIDDFTTLADMKPSAYIDKLWTAYRNFQPYNKDLNGKIFEYILISLLINKKVLPLYIQAKVAFVPNVDFDLLLYTKEKPIVLSAKTSLRERYKQADLEAIALKYVHRKAESFLLTLDKNEAHSVNRKIKEGGVIGIDEVVLATSEKIDHFIRYLEGLNFEEAGSIQIIRASSVLK
ncbi:MAG: hypothetical protein K0U47_06665 [Epsilonproteobacteria bacterium]|nr:hypothetical protein [Campylobacterota bacterium]